MRKENKAVWIRARMILVWYFILLFALIVAFLFVLKDIGFLFVFGPLILLIILIIFSYKLAPGNKVIKGMMVGGMFGWVWGFIGIFAGFILFEGPTITKIVLFLPLYLSFIIFKSEYLFVPFSPIMGIIIGAIVGWIILELKRK